MRCHTSECVLEKANGGKTFKERFQRGSAAANESGVYLKDPIEMSIAVEIR